MDELKRFEPAVRCEPATGAVHNGERPDALPPLEPRHLNPRKRHKRPFNKRAAEDAAQQFYQRLPQAPAGTPVTLVDRRIALWAKVPKRISGTLKLAHALRVLDVAAAGRIAPDVELPPGGFGARAARDACFRSRAEADGAIALATTDSSGGPT